MNTKEATEAAFVVSFNCFAQQVNKTAHDKGWYQALDKINGLDIPADSKKFINTCFNGQRIALMHSELSEGLEGARKDLMDDKVPQFSMLETELADTIIRIMDFAYENNLKVAEALVAKAEYNKSRPHLHGGKAF